MWMTDPKYKYGEHMTLINTKLYVTASGAAQDEYSMKHIQIDKLQMQWLNEND